MEKNRRETSGQIYTIPSPELYPFQWLWDSCFHAIILMHCGDIHSAKLELISAVSRPLENGLIPHIIYWEDPSHFGKWGREHRGDVINGAWGVEGTSSLTQPPIMATTALRLYNAEPDEDFLNEIYPVLKNHYLNLLHDRRFNGDAIVYIINPDESGEDNSPRYDNALGLPPQHSSGAHLDKRIELMRANASCNYEAHTCMSQVFGIADVPFNVLFMENLLAMSTIAELLDEHAAAIRFRLESEAVEKDMREQFHKDGLYLSYDFIAQEFIETKTWAMFMPLYGGLLSDEDAKALVDDYLLNEEHFKTKYAIPTTALCEPSYDSDYGFWRGPVWMAPNMFIYKGLKRYGFDEVAAKLKEDTLALIERSGFREQYDPESGEGYGAHNFTWGGLVLDMD